MKSLIPVMCVITIMLNLYCTKKLDDVQERATQQISQANDVFFITDSSGNTLPAIEFKVDFKWIDSVGAESYIKLYDKTTGGWYHFSTWNIMPQVQKMLIPKYHLYDVYWYNYSQQGNSPFTTKQMILHSGQQLRDTLSIDPVQRFKFRPNVDYSSNNNVLTNFTIIGW